jgi:hypothetical protein
MSKEYSDTDIAILSNDMKYIKGMVDKINRKLDEDYVTQDQLQNLRDRFDLVQRVVFGLVGLILIAVVGALITGVLK